MEKPERQCSLELLQSLTNVKDFLFLFDGNDSFPSAAKWTIINSSSQTIKEGCKIIDEFDAIGARVSKFRGLDSCV